MADEKKPAKATGGGTDRKVLEQAIFLLVGLFLLLAIINGLLSYIEGWGLGTADSLWKKLSGYFLTSVWPVWKFVAAVVSAGALAGVIYNAWKLRAINMAEQAIYNPTSEMLIGSADKVSEVKNEKWEKVMKYLNSGNMSDWRLAIIEADVILEEMLRSRGFPGETVGDMLKSVDKSDFLTLDDAWEAHKIRNAIAHSGADFKLDMREARRAIALFEKVFKEFQVI